MLLSHKEFFWNAIHKCFHLIRVFHRHGLVKNAFLLDPLVAKRNKIMGVGLVQRNAYAHYRLWLLTFNWFSGCWLRLI